MANTNTNKPFGFSPWRYLSGAAWNGQANLYFILANDTGVYSIGDVVISAASTTTAGQYDPNGCSAVKLAAAGQAPRGVVVGCSPVYPGTSLQGSNLNLEQSWLGATKPTSGAYVWVADDPAIIFKAQMKTGTIANSNSLATALDKNCDISVLAGTYVSGTTLDSNTVHTTSTLKVKLLGLVNGPENSGITDLTSTTGDYAVFQCMFNSHELSSGPGIAAI